MRVHHFCTHLDGGAARAARRLHEGLGAMGVETRFHHRVGISPNPGYRRLPPPAERPAQKWLRSVRHRWIQMRHPGRENLSDPGKVFSNPEQRAACAPLADIPAGIVHLHWVAGFLDLPTFLDGLGAGHPVVWTLHDANPATGGCHYPAACTRFRQACGECPLLGADAGPEDRSAYNARVKRDLFRKHRIALVTASSWMESLVRTSGIVGDSVTIHRIPYGIDCEAFAPVDPRLAREALAIAGDLPVVGFAADSASEPRKGFDRLCEALRAMDGGPQVRLVTWGAPPPAAAVGGLVHQHLGFLGSDRLLSLAYSACNVVAVPSLQENSALVALEAQSCGAAVVGFDGTGLDDLLVQGETGLLVANGSVPGLAGALRQVLGDLELSTRMGRAARARIISQFTARHQAEQYVRLYTGLLESGTAEQGAAR